MAWTAEHQSVLDTFAATFGLPTLDGASARAWTRKLAEQFKWNFPGEGEWGTKQASETRPPSTDCICTRVPFVGYDVIIGQGTPEQKLAHNPEPLGLAGQVYLVVEPINHLSGAPVPPTTPSGTPSYPYPDEPTAGQAFQDRVKQAYHDKGRTFPDEADDDAFRHFMRYGYSSHEMPEPDAADKHILELRTELGLGPEEL